MRALAVAWQGRSGSKQRMQARHEHTRFEGQRPAVRLGWRVAPLACAFLLVATGARAHAAHPVLENEPAALPAPPAGVPAPGAASTPRRTAQAEVAARKEQGTPS